MEMLRPYNGHVRMLKMKKESKRTPILTGYNL